MEGRGWEQGFARTVLGAFKTHGPGSSTPHTYPHSLLSTHTHTHLHTHPHTHPYGLLSTCSHTHLHTYHTHAQLHTYAQGHFYTPTHASKPTPTYLHTHRSHSCTMYTQVHTHTHALTHVPTPQLRRAHSCRVPSHTVAWPHPAPPSRAAEHHQKGGGPAALNGHPVMCLEMDNPLVTAPGGTLMSHCCTSRPKDTALGRRGLGLRGGLGLMGSRFPSDSSMTPSHTPTWAAQGVRGWGSRLCWDVCSHVWRPPAHRRPPRKGSDTG